MQVQWRRGGDTSVKKRKMKLNVQLGKDWKRETKDTEKGDKENKGKVE